MEEGGLKVKEVGSEEKDRRRESETEEDSTRIIPGVGK